MLGIVESQGRNWAMVMKSNQLRPVGVILGDGSSSPLSGIVDLARGSIGSHSCVQRGEGKALVLGEEFPWATWKR